MLTNNDKIWLSPPHMGGSELEYIKEAFNTNWIAPIGPNVNAFENDISNFINQASLNPVSTTVLSSGTAAMHLAMIILNVQENDAVLVQSFTFCGTTNPVLYQGAEVVFIDSELDTWNMDPIALSAAIEDLISNGYGIENHIEPKEGKGYIKAIVPVHLYGMPAKMDEILFIANQHSIPIIEDAAESLGSAYKAKKCGSFGDIAALSFNGNKIITTSSGGALISSNRNYVEKALFLSTQARDNAPHYQHSELGFNYRMGNIVAGVGRGQMEVLQDRVNKRRQNNARYRAFFKNIDGVVMQTEPNEDFYSNYWLTCILVDPDKTGGITNEMIRLKFADANIECRLLWKPMHLQPLFKGSKIYGNGCSEYFFNHGLCLPSGSSLTDKEFERIFEVLSSVFNR